MSQLETKSDCTFNTIYGILRTQGAPQPSSRFFDLVVLEQMSNIQKLTTDEQPDWKSNDGHKFTSSGELKHYNYLTIEILDAYASDNVKQTSPTSDLGVTASVLVGTRVMETVGI